MAPKFSEPVLKTTEEAVSEAEGFICERKEFGRWSVSLLQRPFFYWLKFTPLSVIDPVPVTVQVRFAPVKEVSVSEYDPMSMDAGCTHTSISTVQFAVRITASLPFGRRLAWTLTSLGAQFSKLTNRASSRFTNLTGFVSPTKNPRTCRHGWWNGSSRSCRRLQGGSLRASQRLRQ